MNRHSPSLVIAIAWLAGLTVADSWADPSSNVQQLRADAAARATPGTSRGLAAFGIVPAGQEENPNFTLTVLLPVLYNSNADTSETAGTPSAEYNPEVRLAWKQAFPHELTLSALLDVNSDRYPSSHGSNSDAAYGRFRVQHVSGRNDQELQPFIEYSPRLELTPFFSAPTSTNHDVLLGVDQSINYQDFFHTRAIRKGHSSDETVWAITYTVDAWRRHTNNGPDSTRVELHPALSWYPLGESWNVTLEINVVPTWYDKQSGSGRRDIATTTIMTFEYVPPWLPKHTKLDFQVVSARVDSTQPNSSFQQWIVGPYLSAVIPL